MKKTLLSIVIISLSITVLFSNASKANSYLSIKYGVTQMESNIKKQISAGTPTIEEEDEGYMISAGYMFGGNLGLDFMYYDLGEMNIKLSAKDQIIFKKNTYIAESAGTISSNLTGFGSGIIFTTTQNIDTRMLGYLKTGIHAWEKTGKTTILDNDNAFNQGFFNKGVGAYVGLGASFKIADSTFFDLSYDMLGISNSANFDDNSSLLSAGFKFNF